MSLAGAQRPAGAAPGGAAPRPPSGGIMENRAAPAAGAQKVSSGAKPTNAATPATGAGAAGYGRRPSSGTAPAAAANGASKPGGAPHTPSAAKANGATPASAANPAAAAPMGGAGAGGGNPYGNSMYGGGMSGYGSLNDNYNNGGNSDAGGMNAYGSMGGMDPQGSMYGMGGGMGSMYGMGGPMGSMYGMGGGGMGSMYGMGGMGGSMYGANPMMGSMYGMGGPMGSMYGMGGMGSMYGMNPMMGSMYGMGGPMGSMYGMGGGMGSMMGRSMSFSSYGGGSLYGSMGGGSLYGPGGIGSMYGLGGQGVNGMWGVESGYKVRSRRERDMPTMAKMLKSEEDVDKNRHLVTETQKLLEKEGKIPASKAEGGSSAADASAAAKKKDEEEPAKKNDAAKADADKKDVKDAKEEKAKDGDKKTRGVDEKDPKRSLGAKKDGVEDDVVAFEDTNAIHSIFVIEDPKSDRVKVEKSDAGQKVILQGPAGKPVECKATEVMRGPEADVDKSGVLRMMASHVKSGHNVCLIAVDTSDKLSAQVSKTITKFFTESLSRLSEEEKWKAAFSATAITGSNKYRDLTKPGGEPQDIVFGSNPIFGPCIMDTKPVELREAPAIEKHVKDALAKKADAQEIVFLQAIVHIRKGKDLFLCSMNVFVLRATEAFEAAAILDDRRIPVPLLRTAIGGATRTSLVIALTGAPGSAAAEGDVTRVASTLCAKENLAPRSGNVPRFIEYTDEQIAKIEKDMPNLSGESKERRAHMVDKMRTMANDAKELIANPDAEAKVYPVHSKNAASPASPKDRAAANAPQAPVTPAQPQTAAKSRELPSPKKNGAAAPAATPATGAGAPAAATAATAAAAAATSAAAPADAAAPAATAEAPGNAAAAAAAVAAGQAFAAPAAAFSSVHRLVYVRDAKAASVGKAVEVVVDGETKAYDVDECIDCPVGAEVPSLLESKDVPRMSGILIGGFNVALLGAELVAPKDPSEQMTWRYVKQTLAGLLAPATPEMTNEVVLYMSVLHERDVVADLISGNTEKHRLVVATSPLFGPMVHEATPAKVRNVEELHATIDKALATAKPCMDKENTLIVMTAVLKQMLAGDVRVASLFAVSAADMTTFKSIVDRNPKFSRSLFTYALGGPASAALLISASRNTNPTELATALSAQRSVSHMKVLAPRNGSVKEFLQYARESLERQKKRAAAMPDGAEKEQTANSIRRLEESLKDHDELLAAPLTVDPRAYPPDPSKEGNKDKTPAQSPQPAAAGAAAGAATAAAAPEEAAQPRATSSRQVQRAVKVQPRDDPAIATPQADVKPAAPAEAPAAPQEAAEKAATPAESAKAAAEEAPQPVQLHAEEQQQAQAAPQEGEATPAAEEKAPSPAAVHQDAAAEPAKTPQDPHSRPVKFLAVVTAEMRSGLQVKEGWSVEGGEGELIVTDVEGPHKFEADDVVVRQNRSSAIQSPVLEELRNKFLEGQNVALITADCRGSAASLETVDRTVRGVLGKLPSSAALYLSLCALKEHENTALDTLKADATFQPVEISTSPLFGPSIAGATFVRVDAADRFVQLMGASLRKCGETRSCVILQLLQVEPKEDDVCVSSLLAVMCPGDIGVYRRALDVPVKERGLFSLALGGSCHTVYAAGFTKQPVDESCLLLPRLAQALKASVRNLKPRDNSMRRFIEHTKGAVQQVQRNMERATSAEEKARMQHYLETVQNMIVTSEAYIADSADKIPPTYPVNRRSDRAEL